MYNVHYIEHTRDIEVLRNAKFYDTQTTYINYIHHLLIT